MCGERGRVFYLGKAGDFSEGISLQNLEQISSALGNFWISIIAVLETEIRSRELRIKV